MKECACFAIVKRFVAGLPNDCSSLLVGSNFLDRKL